MLGVEVNGRRAPLVGLPGEVWPKDLVGFAGVVVGAENRASAPAGSLGSSPRREPSRRARACCGGNHRRRCPVRAAGRCTAPGGRRRGERGARVPAGRRAGRRGGGSPSRGDPGRQRHPARPRIGGGERGADLARRAPASGLWRAGRRRTALPSHRRASRRFGAAPRSRNLRRDGGAAVRDPLGPPAPFDRHRGHGVGLGAAGRRGRRRRSATRVVSTAWYRWLGVGGSAVACTVGVAVFASIGVGVPALLRDPVRDLQDA